jgi:hypothetical protein
MVTQMDESVVLLKVPAHMCAQGGKAMFHLHSHMCSLDFRMEPSFDCVDDDSGDTSFVEAKKFIRGQDAVVEFVGYGMYPRSLVSVSRK